MASDEEVLIVLNSLAEVQACQNCGTRVRFGDRDCSHCGADLEDAQRAWAERLVDRLKEDGASE